MKKCLLYIVFISFTVFGNDENMDMDRLLAKMRSSPESKLAVDQYNHFIDSMFRSEIPKNKRGLYNYITNTYKIAKRINYKHGMAMAQYHLGKYHISTYSNYSKAIPAILTSLTLYEREKDSLGISQCYLQLGVISYVTQYFEDGIKNFKHSLRYHNNPTSTYLLAISYTELNNFVLSKKYFFSAIDEYKKTNKIKGLNECYMYLGKMYLSEQDFDSAYYYLKLTLPPIMKSDSEEDFSRPYALISEYFFLNRRLDSALYYAQKSYKLTKLKDDQISAVISTEIISKVYEEKKDFRKALYFLQLHYLLKNENMKGDTKQKIAEMHDMFDFTRKMDKEKQKHREEIYKKNRTKNIFLVTGLFVLLVSGGLWSRLDYVRKSKAALQHEKNVSESLLLNILPLEIAQELKENGSAKARNFKNATILFTDFKSFTEFSEKLSASDLVKEINECFIGFDSIMDKYSIEKIKTIGDAYLAAGGIPIPSEDSVKNTVLAALEMQEYIIKRKEQLEISGLPAFEMRVGVHTGPVVAGIVGVKKFQYDIWGDTVNTASRIESCGVVGKVNISQATYDLLKDDITFTFESRGKIEAKGKGEIEMWFVSRSV